MLKLVKICFKQTFVKQKLDNWFCCGNKLYSDDCVSCIKGKICRKPFNESGTRATDILSLIHTDLCGPMEVGSIAGSRYMLIFLRLQQEGIPILYQVKG